MKSVITTTKFTLLFLFLISSLEALNAQVSSYIFSNASGTYSAISGGTLHTPTTSPFTADDVNYSFSLPFAFVYNGASYTVARPTTNGFLVLGGAVPSSTQYEPLSTGSTNFAIAGLGADLVSTVRSEVLGTSPNRVYVCQWGGANRYSLTETLNFQIRLHETTNVIEVIYGASSITNTTIATRPVQVGLRGSADTDFNNRTTTTNWAATGAGGTNAATCGVTTAVYPASGQIFRWTPNPCTAPNTPTAMTFPSSGTTFISGSFVAPTTAPTGYIVVRSNSATPTIPTNGTVYTTGAAGLGGTILTGNNTISTATTFSATGLTASTTYYFHVYAYNSSACSGGPVYSPVLTSSAATTGCPTYSGTMPVGPTGVFPTLTAAVSTLTSCGYTGNIVLELQSTYSSTSETFPLTISNAIGSTSTKTITIRPEIGATPVITSANTTGTVFINGADYIYFDGRPGGIGSTKSLTISNTSTSGYTIFYDNDATNNAVSFCIVEGVGTSTSSGTIRFGSTAPVTGNDNIVIDNNEIRAGATTNFAAIYSLGNLSSNPQNNSNITISNNLISNFHLNGGSAYGMNVNVGNRNWTISGNSFYQTAARVATSASSHYAIFISNSGNNFTILNNVIGGSTAGAGGSAWTVTGSFANAFYGIYLAPAGGSTNNIEGNTIRNIAWTTIGSNNFAAIYITGGGNQVLSNIIGSQTGTGSIIFTQVTSTGGLVYGIFNSANGTNSFSNNEMGSITMNTVTTNTLSTFFYGIRSSAGTNTISNNIIGGTTAHSIQGLGGANTNSNAATLAGISCVGGTNTISSNIIRNISYRPSGGTGPGSQVSLGGIYVTGTNTISSNTIHDLASNSKYETFGTLSSVFGIYDAGANTSESIVDNVIYNLKNTNTSALSIVLVAIATSNTSAGGTIARNRVYGFENLATGTFPFISAFMPNGGNWTFANNMISLNNGSNTNGMQCTGVYDGGASGTRNYYYNSIYIYGSSASAQNSVALQFDGAGGTANIYNNILHMARTGSGKNYAIANLGSMSNFNSNYNAMLTSNPAHIAATSGITDRTFASWRTFSGDDLNSEHNPEVAYANVAIADLHLVTPLCTMLEKGGTPLSLTTDFDGETRHATTPDIGADEFDGTRPQNIAAAGLPLEICLGEETTLSASSVDPTYTYSWNNGAGSGASVDVSPTTTTTYTVTATNPGGCVKTEQVTVTLKPSPTPVVISNPGGVVCGTSVVNLTASGGLVPNAVATASSGPLGTVIPDNILATGMSHALNITGIPSGATVSKVNVLLNITHSFDGDVIVNLEAPNGQIVNLIKNRGSSGDNFTNTIVSSDNTLPAFTTSSSPFTGSFTADLSASTGTTPASSTVNFSDLFSVPNGNWRIRIYDDAGGDVGTLENWSISVTYTASSIVWSASPTTPNTLFTDAGLTTAYDGVSSATSLYASFDNSITYTATSTFTGCSISDNVAFTLSPESEAPTSILGIGTMCHGSQVTLTQSGGALATGGNYEWFTGSCGGTPVGTGNSITVSPTSATTYYVRAGAGTACPASTCASGAVTLPTAGTTLSGNESATCFVSGTNWVRFYNTTTGNFIASINPNGRTGTMTVQSFTGSPSSMLACDFPTSEEYRTAYMGRNFIITTTGLTGSGDVDILFPFLESEYFALESAAGFVFDPTGGTLTPSNPTDNLDDPTHLKVTKYSHAGFEDGTPLNNCVGGVSTWLNQSEFGYLNTAPYLIPSAQYIVTSTSSFSEFYLHGSSLGSPLPVTLTSLNATCDADDVVVSWATASEANSSHFEVQRSRDLFTWETTDVLQATGNSNQLVQYTATDSDPISGTVYYRLRQVDNDGKEAFFGPVSVDCGNNTNMIHVFPNPSSGAFTVEITSVNEKQGAVVQLIDGLGKIISSKSIDLSVGVNQFFFDEQIESGAYMIRVLQANDEFEIVKLVMKN